MLNNPLSYTDPSGEYIQYIFMAGAFAVDYLSNLLNQYFAKKSCKILKMREIS